VAETQRDVETGAGADATATRGGTKCDQCAGGRVSGHYNENFSASLLIRSRPKPIVIDVDKIYNDYEDQLNAARRQKLGADSLNLKRYDINLRRHRITGGIYMIDYLEQPEQDVQIGKKALLRNCKRGRTSERGDS
jgi:hypothetical protein